jgi:hypothetical protein
MSITDGRWEQAQPFTDLQIFRGPSDWLDTSGFATYVQLSNGLYSLHVPAGDASTFVTDLFGLHRTGQYATPAYNQEQFGTAAAQPGPSLVSGTSGPDAFTQPMPPVLAGLMTTTTGSLNQTAPGGILTGPRPKGMQATSIDIIYRVNTANATLATVSTCRTVFANLVAPVVTVGLAVTNMLLPFNANPYVINNLITAPFLVAPDTEVLGYVNLTAGAGGSIDFFGSVTHYNFNFN